MEQSFTIANWTVYPESNFVVSAGRRARLEPRVMDLLVYLAERQGEVLNRNQIFRDVWHDAEVGEGALLTAVSTLRQALGDDPRRPRIIQTIPKRGYRLIAPTSARTAALAVLPFRDVSMQANESYLAEGISELLMSDLGRTPKLRVISWPSVASFRESPLPLREIAEQLGARYVVEGSVLHAGDRVRVSIRLNDTSGNLQLWSDTVEVEMGELLGVQRALAKRIAGAISGRLAAASGPWPPAAPEQSDAMVAYLRGRFHWYKMTPGHFERALEYFEQARTLDPSFGPAYAGVSDVWGAFAYWGLQPLAAVRDRIWAPLESALGCEEAWAEVHMQVGIAHFYLERHWAEAEAHLRRAIELNPNIAHAHLLYGLFAMTLERRDAADWIDNATRLDPLNPAVQLARALLAMSRDRLGEAAEHVQRVLEVEPAHPPGNQLRANLAWRSGDKGAGRLEARLWAGDPEISECIAESTGDPRRAMLQVAQVLQDRARSQYVQPLRIARAYVIGDDAESALDVLEAAHRSDDLMQIDLLQSDCIWQTVRPHPRFRRLLARIGIPA